MAPAKSREQTTKAKAVGEQPTTPTRKAPRTAKAIKKTPRIAKANKKATRISNTIPARTAKTGLK